MNSKRSPPRSANCPEVYHEGNGSSAADWPAALLCHPYVRHHRPGVLQRETAQHLRTAPGNSGYSRAPSVSGFGTWGHAAPRAELILCREKTSGFFFRCNYNWKKLI